jgi:hypothetical protein
MCAAIIKSIPKSSPTIFNAPATSGTAARAAGMAGADSAQVRIRQDSRRVRRRVEVAAGRRGARRRIERTYARARDRFVVIDGICEGLIWEKM